MRGRGEEVREQLRMLSHAGAVGQVIRHHGDYHLGQVLWTGEGWVMLDFEGEPARSLPERRRKRSPLRDVAGMLRSFAYAATRGARSQHGVEPPDGLGARAREAFLSGTCRGRPEPDPVRPGARAAAAVFELEKAVYELRYELDNRPDWVRIPVAGIARLLEAECDARRREGVPIALGELDLYLAGEGRHERLYDVLGAHLRETASRSPSGRRTRARSRSSATSTTGRAAEPDGTSALRHLGGRRRRRRAGAALQVRAPDADGQLKLKADPFAFAAEVPPHTASIVYQLEHEWRDDEWVERARATRSRSHEPMSIYEVHLGSWRRNPLEGNRSLTYRELARRARRLRGRLGLHARRAAAGDGASVLGLVGLSGDRLLRADLALRRRRTTSVFVDHLHQRGHRRDPRLGARALPARRLGARPLRRHRALRARRSAPRRAPRLGHARLQLRAARGAELPARERAVLAARVPHRRPARRRRRVDALPRLLAQARASGCRTRSAGARTSTRSRS